MGYNFYLKNLHDALTSMRLNPVSENIPPDMWYPDTTPDGFISYLRERDVDAFLESRERTDFRKAKQQQVKPGKFLYKVGVKEPDKVNELIAMLKPPALMVIQGDQIPWAYNGNNYANDSSSLGSSCMRQSQKQGYFSIYKNGRMLVAHKGPIILARAVIWHDVVLKDGTKIPVLLDRIYGKERYVQAFKTYAKEHNWYTKKLQSCSDNRFESPSGEVVSGEKSLIKLKYPTPLHGLHPYMDTFYGYQVSGGMITHLEAHERGGIRALRSTSGSYPAVCKVCGETADYAGSICHEHMEYARKPLRKTCPHCDEKYEVKYYLEEHQGCINSRMYECKEHGVSHIAETAEELEACSCGGKYEDTINIE